MTIDEQLPDDEYTRQLVATIESDPDYEIANFADRVAARIAQHVTPEEAVACIERMVMSSHLWTAVEHFDALPAEGRSVFADALAGLEVERLLWKRRWPVYILLFVYLRACGRAGVVPDEKIDGALLGFMNHYGQLWIAENGAATRAGMREALQVLPQERLVSALCKADRFQAELSLACLTPEVVARLVDFIAELPAKLDTLQEMQVFRFTGIYRKGAQRQVCDLTPVAETLAAPFADALRAHPAAPQRHIFVWTLVDAARAGSDDGYAGLASALEHKSKPTRELAADQLRRLDPERVRPHLEPLLTSKKKAARLAAEDLLGGREA